MPLEKKSDDIRSHEKKYKQLMARRRHLQLELYLTQAGKRQLEEELSSKIIIRELGILDAEDSNW